MHRLVGHLKNSAFCVFSGFRREVAESCALLGCYTASGDNFFKELALLAVLMKLCILFTLRNFPRFVSLWQRRVGLCDVTRVGDISGYQSGDSVSLGV